MRRATLRNVAAAFALAAAVAAARAEAPLGAPLEAPLGTPAATPATIVMSRQIDFTSAINGRSYRIQVALPFGPPPKDGFPVLYVLDGDAYFGTYASAVRLLSATNEIESAIVVGVGYPDSQDNPMNSMIRRNYDLTPSVDADAAQMLAAMTKGKITFGHAEEFFSVIQKEVKPRVAALAPVNARRSVIFGHSLGGLFVVHTLFTHPDAFQTYLALSPSLFFDHRAVLRDEAAFSQKVTTQAVAPRIFIGVGGEEANPPRHALVPGMTKDGEAKMRTQGAMIANATDLSQRLARLNGGRDYAVGFEVFPGQTHQSGVWASVVPFLNFALPLEVTPP